MTACSKAANVGTEKLKIMSMKEFGGYKRIVQYFWDPEPKNDDPLKPTTWCLGRRYDLLSDSDTSCLTYQELGNNDLPSSPQGNPGTKTSTSRSDLADAKSDLPGKSNRLREEDGGWPHGFLDDFEARIWFTYRSGFPVIQKSEKPEAAASMAFAVRLRSQLIDQGGFSSDTGWGCMIRSGQSLIANTLLILRLGRGMAHPFHRQNEYLTVPQTGDGECNNGKKEN